MGQACQPSLRAWAELCGWKPALLVCDSKRRILKHFYKTSCFTSKKQPPHHLHTRLRGPCSVPSRYCATLGVKGPSPQGPHLGFSLDGETPDSLFLSSWRRAGHLHSLIKLLFLGRQGLLGSPLRSSLTWNNKVSTSYKHNTSHEGLCLFFTKPYSWQQERSSAVFTRPATNRDMDTWGHWVLFFLTLFTDDRKDPNHVATNQLFYKI